MGQEFDRVYSLVARLVHADNGATLEEMFTSLITACERVPYAKYNMAPLTSTLEKAFQIIGVTPGELIMIDPFDETISMGSFAQVTASFDELWRPDNEQQFMLLDSNGKWLVGINESGGLHYSIRSNPDRAASS